VKGLNIIKHYMLAARQKVVEQEEAKLLSDGFKVRVDGEFVKNVHNSRVEMETKAREG